MSSGRRRKKKSKSRPQNRMDTRQPSSRGRVSKKTRAKLITDTAAVISVKPGDNNISMALETARASHFEHVYVLDPNYSRSDPMYSHALMQSLMEKVKAAGCRVHYANNERLMMRRSEWKRFSYMVTLPCDNWTSDGKMKLLLDKARSEWKTRQRFAMAPTYELQPSWANSLIFLLHMFMTVVSFFTWFGQYRGTFVVVEVLSRQVEEVQRPSYRWFNRDKAPYIYGGTGCRTVAPPNRQGVTQFLYLTQRESFNLRIWACLIVYVTVVAVPFWILLPSMYGPFEGWRELANNRYLSIWLIHGLVSLLVIHKYFDTPYWMIHAVILPALMTVWVFFTFHARWLYRGYSTAPKFTLPSFTGGGGHLSTPLRDHAAMDAGIFVNESSSSDGSSDESADEEEVESDDSVDSEPKTGSNIGRKDGKRSGDSEKEHIRSKGPIEDAGSHGPSAPSLYPPDDGR